MYYGTARSAVDAKTAQNAENAAEGIDKRSRTSIMELWGEMGKRGMIDQIMMNGAKRGRRVPSRTGRVAPGTDSLKCCPRIVAGP